MKELHKIKHIGWLRAAVLGAIDRIVSTASLVIGVAAAHATHASTLCRRDRRARVESDAMAIG